MARIDSLGHFLTDVADAIREKKGSSDTIQASDFDTEIENLPSGSASDYIDVSTDLAQIIDICGTNLNNRPVYTNNPITIYRPFNTVYFYAIHKRSSGKYRVAWGGYAYLVFTSTTLFRFAMPEVSLNNNGLASGLCSPYNRKHSFHYYSNEVDTLEELIQKMQTSGGLTYTQMLNSSDFGFEPETPYRILYSNAPALVNSTRNGSNCVFTELVDAQILSHNETLV